MVNPGIYRHYKGKFYSVLGLVRNSETEELMVLYIPLYLIKADTSPTQLCVRPLENFMEKFKRVDKN